MKRIAGLVIASFLLVGCAARGEKLPPVRWHGKQDAIEVLAHRADAIESVSSQGLLTLVRPDGRSVRFDLAMVRHKDDGVRLRAWKLGRAVFDLTMTDAGVWLLTPDEPSLKERVRSVGISARQLVEAWSVFNGEFFRSGGELTETRDMLIYRDEGVTCFIDRRTLTPRRYILTDDRGRERFRLDLDDYHLIDGHPFPHRYIASSGDGSIRVSLRDVEINSQLAPSAFRPPRRGEKLP